MSKDHIIAGIDIGSYKIRTIIGVIDEGRPTPHIIGTGVVFSNGIRKGKIVDLKELVDNINASLEEAETVSGIPVQQAFISISNSQIASFESKGVIAISGNEITEEDLQRALESAKNTTPIEPGIEVIDVIAKNYFIDNGSAITNPVGLSGTRLEAFAEIITGTESALQNIKKSINQVGVEIVKMVPATIASNTAVLTKKQKEIGVVNIDIGSSSTGISVYEEGVLLYSGGIPVGGENVTNDIAIGTRSSIETAEKLKIEFGDLISTNLREEIDLAQLSEVDSGKISKKHLNEIIRARYEEIFTMVNHELKTIGKDGMLPGGIVITGGGAKIEGLEEICKNIMNLPAQIGFPCEITTVVDKINDPEYATAVGLIKYGSEFGEGGGGFDFGNVLGGFSGFGEGIGKWLKSLLPS
ncbi:cell division protein FtsA [Candidatus Gracilibacteria bacterium]|nr:cell division protein FtsA [Candidatus Gracilibacteria bacterium]